MAPDFADTAGKQDCTGGREMSTIERAAGVPSPRDPDGPGRTEPKLVELLVKG